MPLKLRIVVSFIIDVIVVGIIIGVCMTIFGCSVDDYNKRTNELNVNRLTKRIQLEEARIIICTGDVVELQEVLASVMSQYDQMIPESQIRLMHVADSVSFDLQQVMWKLEQSQARKLKAEQSLVRIDKEYYSTNTIAP